MAPWIVLGGLALFGWSSGSKVSKGLAVAAAGAGLVVKQLYRYPTHGYQPVEEVTSLLERLDAGPVTGLAMEVRGKVIGRATPGYVLSPDLVIQDQSGSVPLRYWSVRLADDLASASGGSLYPAMTGQFSLYPCPRHDRIIGPAPPPAACWKGHQCGNLETMTRRAIAAEGRGGCCRNCWSA